MIAQKYSLSVSLPLFCFLLSPFLSSTLIVSLLLILHTGSWRPTMPMRKIVVSTVPWRVHERDRSCHTVYSSLPLCPLCPPYLTYSPSSHLLFHSLPTPLPPHSTPSPLPPPHSLTPILSSPPPFSHILMYLQVMTYFK